MKLTRIHTPQERQAARLRSECRARMGLVQLLSTVSILRTALTRILPLAGCATWWVTLVCLLPGLATYLLAKLAMRRSGASTLTGMMRACLGQTGGWLLPAVLGALLLLDGASSLTALITLFTEGIGTRGTQLTLALLTGGVLVTCLHREGLPRGVQLLRWALLAGTVIVAGVSLPQLRLDGLYPLLGDGWASLGTALRAGVSLAWPLLLLLTVREEAEMPRGTALGPVLLGALLPLLFVCLRAPHERLVQHQGLAEALLLPAQYAPGALRTLSQCLLMLSLFLAVGGAVQLGTDYLCAPVRQSPGWLPWLVLAILTATQGLDTARLWRVLEAVGPWLLLPLSALVGVGVVIAVIGRDRI